MSAKPKKADGPKVAKVGDAKWSELRDGIAERNAEAQKAGQARRKTYEQWRAEPDRSPKRRKSS